jgi:hypothetical protein
MTSRGIPTQSQQPMFFHNFYSPPSLSLTHASPSFSSSLSPALFFFTSYLFLHLPSLHFLVSFSPKKNIHETFFRSFSCHGCCVRRDSLIFLSLSLSLSSLPTPFIFVFPLFLSCSRQDI